MLIHRYCYALLAAVARLGGSGGRVETRTPSSRYCFAWAGDADNKDSDSLR
jgi:hypothetical protein